MTRQIIATDLAPQPDAPISQAVRVGQLVFVSGITPFTRELGLAKEDFPTQMRQVMHNLTTILHAAGSSIDRVVKCVVILARREDWRAMNEIYKTYWPGKDFPARTAFEAKLPHPNFLVEIECVAEV
jgi:2-iminobutanoate/2-iminopropanoate deaminase